MTPAVQDTLLQLVSFRLGDEEFAVNVGQVQEIVRLTTITAVPRSPDFVEGVINLRGRIVPVIDLATRFGMPGRERSKVSRIIITEVAGRTVGMRVDAVNEVLRLDALAIEAASEVLRDHVSADYITGIGKLDGRLLIMLDLNRLLTREETGTLTEAAAEAAEG
jgi:purine-binding chemotaxis protein CheW